MSKTHKNKTFRLSHEAIRILEELMIEFSKHLDRQVSFNKLVETLIRCNEHISVENFINKYKGKKK
jgi:hypothetical protein